MPKGKSDDVHQIIVQALSRGLSRGEISQVVGVSKRAITRVSTNLKKHGTPRAPPTGVKQGRPSKMNREQAEAMLRWVAQKYYSFYVKELVSFLKENYGYKGCDGTVRRSLVRAGFRRKLPWHKSEITTWLPPPEIPDLDVIIEGPVVPASSPFGARDGHPSDVNEGEDEPSELPHDSIDPGLEDQSQQQIQRVEQPEMTASAAQPEPSQADQPHPPSAESSFPQSGLSSFQPSLQLAQMTVSEAEMPIAPQPQQSQPKKRRKSQKNDNDLQEQVTSLQDKVSQQQNLILQLQQQLAQSQGQSGTPAQLQASGLPALQAFSAQLQQQNAQTPQSQQSGSIPFHSLYDGVQ